MPQSILPFCNRMQTLYFLWLKFLCVARRTLEILFTKTLIGTHLVNDDLLKYSEIFDVWETIF